MSRTYLHLKRNFHAIYLHLRGNSTSYIHFGKHSCATFKHLRFLTTTSEIFTFKTSPPSNQISHKRTHPLAQNKNKKRRKKNKLEKTLCPQQNLPKKKPTKLTKAKGMTFHSPKKKRYIYMCVCVCAIFLLELDLITYANL